jgi:hypothetical protein
MGLFVLYRKVSETETEVAYQYGDSETELNQRLVIDKTGPIGRPKVCPDGIGQKVIAWVNSERTTDQWPDGGAIQS